jgi:arginyl-tRNA synthetase
VAGDQEALRLWQRFRDLSIVKYEETYARLNVRFDFHAGESLVKRESISNALELLEAKKLLSAKTEKESLNDWAERRRAGLLNGGETEDPGKAEDDGRPAALAVDLLPYKLGKPVVQKPGRSLKVLLRRPHRFRRWNDDLYRAGYCWRDRAV